MDPIIASIAAGVPAPSRLLASTPKAEPKAPAINKQGPQLQADEARAGISQPAEDEARAQGNDSEAVQKAVDEANQRVNRLSNNAIRFRIDDETGITVISVVDRDTDEVIRQIPPEEIMRINASISEFKGLLVNSQG